MAALEYAQQVLYLADKYAKPNSKRRRERRVLVEARLEWRWSPLKPGAKTPSFMM
jgi:hypothetical protein